MKIFKKLINSSHDKCLICNTSKMEPVVLVLNDGKEESGIIECLQVHVDCLKLRYSPERKILYQQKNDHL